MNYHASPEQLSLGLGVAQERARLRQLRDEIARDAEGKARRRRVLDHADQLEYDWERRALSGGTELRVR